MAIIGNIGKKLFSARNLIIIAVVVALLAVAFAAYYIYTQRDGKAFVPNAEYYPVVTAFLAMYIGFTTM